MHPLSKHFLRSLMIASKVCHLAHCHVFSCLICPTARVHIRRKDLPLTPSLDNFGRIMPHLFVFSDPTPASWKRSATILDDLLPPTELHGDCKVVFGLHADELRRSALLSSVPLSTAAWRRFRGTRSPMLQKGNAQVHLARYY